MAEQIEQQFESDILDAVQSGDIATLKKFLDEGVPVDLTDEEGWSLLHHAAALGQVEVISLLHEKGCHVDMLDNEGRTPLHYAATNGDIETIRLLIAMDSNVNSVDNEGNTPLKWSVMCEQNAAIGELTKHRGTVDIEEVEPSDDNLDVSTLVFPFQDPSHILGDGNNEVCHSSQTELTTNFHHVSTAVKSNDSYKHSDHNSHQTDVVTTQQCMDANADTTQLEGDIFEAAQCGDTATVKGYLDLGIPVDITDKDGWSPVHHAIAHRQVEVIRLLIERGCLMNPVKIKTLKEGRVTHTSEATIFDAAQCGDTATVKGYLDLGVPVDIVDEDGWSPVNHAIAHRQVDVIRLLMDRGCLMNPVKNRKQATKSGDVHITTEGGSKYSPYNNRQLYEDVFEAAQCGDTATIQSYLNSGGPVDLTNEVGRTLLHCAAGEDQIKVVELLIKRGCCIDPVDRNGWTPSIYATACGHVQTVQLIKQQLNEQYLTDSVDIQGARVLHYAAQFAQIHMIEMLAERGLDVNIGDNDGWTPLHYAATYGQLESVRTLLRLGGRKSMTKKAGTGGTPLHQAVVKGYKDIVLLLLNEGCPINVVDSKGRSVLHFAARYGQIHMIEMLSEQGLDVNIGDDVGLTPLHAAAACGELESVHTLLRLGGRDSMTKVAGTRGTPLHQAVERGHKDIVLLLLNEGCPINVVDCKGRSILHCAARYGQIHMVEMMSEQGLDVNIGDDEGLTPLHAAAACGELESVHTLLRLGGRKSMTKVVGTHGTPLHQAVERGQKNIVSLLLNEGCPINVVDSKGRSVLHYAASFGQIHMIEMLAEKGLDVNLGDNEGGTLLHYAAASGQLESVRTLLRICRRGSMTEVAGAGGTPLHQAVALGHKDIVSLLLNEGCPINVVDSEGASVLHRAAQCGQIHMIEMLAKRGLNVNIGDDKGQNPLHYAADRGQLESVLTLLRLGGRESMTKGAGTCGTPLHRAVEKGHRDIVSLLLNEGCPINVVDGGGSSVLHIAAESGQIHLIQLLAEQGLDVNTGNDVGMTPLHAAAACGQTKALHTLLKWGGRKSVTKIFGNAGTPLHQAVGNGHKDIVSLLLNEGCPIDVVDSKCRSALHCAAQGGQIDMIEMLSEQGLDVNIGDDEGLTPLHYAAIYGQLESVRTLLRLGGRESMTKVAGSHGAPLHQAVEKGHRDIVSLLLNEGCPINVVDSKGRSVLHYAAQGGQIDMIEMLAKQGLNVNISDDKGQNPLHYAVASGQIESVLTLLRLGGRESMTKVAGTCGTPLHRAVVKGHKDIVSLMLNEGCPISIVGSALHCAAEFGWTHMLEMLAEQGLDVNIGDDECLTPLHYAAVYGQLESVRTLLRLGGRESMTKVAGIYGTPLHQAVENGHKDIVSLLLNEGCPINVVNSIGKSVLHFAAHGCQIDMIEMLAEQGLNVNKGDDEGLTPLHYAAERGHITTFNELVSIGGNVHHMDNFGMKCSDYILIRQNFVTVIQFCVACGLECDDEDLLGVISALSAKSLLDMNRILCLAAVFGDVSIFDAMVTSQYPLNQQKLPKIANFLSFESGGKKLPDQFHVSEESLNPLHISILSEYFNFSPNIKFIEKLTSHPRTQYTVNELFPNGLSPLDVARKFELHDIAVIVERAGGGPGAWADLPKKIEDKAIDLFMSLKELRGMELGGDVTSRIVSLLGYPLVISDQQEVKKILEETPKRSLIQKHVLSSLKCKGKWESVGDLLEVDEDILEYIGKESTDDDGAYRSVLKHWLKHGRNVSWKTLLDAVGDFETKKTVDHITDNIVKELAPSQVSIQIGSFHFKLQTSVVLHTHYYIVLCTNQQFPYTCNVCMVAFTDMDSMHLSSHSGKICSTFTLLTVTDPVWTYIGSTTAIDRHSRRS